MEVVESPDQSEPMEVQPQNGCKHYKRNCKLVAPCCNKAYPCRFCHDEDNENHAINRKLVKEVVCIQCDTRQITATQCAKCELPFGNYVCLICNLFDLEDRKQFHCEDCGMCRVGGRDNYYHCKTCDICLPIKLKNSHKCIEKVAHDNCAVCLEDLHSSRIPSHIPPCGHLIHTSCYDQLHRNGHYACPLCGASMMDMTPLWQQMDEEIASTPMPEEYRTVSLCVLCKDCHKESKVLYHIIGLKCEHCGSYNTCRVKDPNCPESTGSTEDESSGGDLSEEEDDDETLTLTITNQAQANGASLSSNIEIALDSSNVVPVDNIGSSSTELNSSQDDANDTDNDDVD
uniref:RING finger and CHY zinc finger domain-containing protein 1 n=1 Tax=Cacopsylla melanoneura TaxID=428564 RepID=A0A8D9ED85_9HEMI